jgi:hypothetical protein
MATRPKRPRDINQLAKLIVDIAVGDAPQDATPTKKQVSGSKGGIKGGRTRMNSLSEEEKKILGLRGATARWDKKKIPKA